MSGTVQSPIERAPFYIDVCANPSATDAVRRQKQELGALNYLGHLENRIASPETVSGRIWKSRTTIYDGNIAGRPNLRGRIAIIREDTFWAPLGRLLSRLFCCLR